MKTEIIIFASAIITILIVIGVIYIMRRKKNAYPKHSGYTNVWNELSGYPKYVQKKFTDAFLVDTITHEIYVKPMSKLFDLLRFKHKVYDDTFGLYNKDRTGHNYYFTAASAQRQAVKENASIMNRKDLDTLLKSLPGGTKEQKLIFMSQMFRMDQCYKVLARTGDLIKTNKVQVLIAMDNTPGKRECIYLCIQAGSNAIWLETLPHNNAYAYIALCQKKATEDSLAQV